MEEVRPTRTELLQRRAQIQLAEQGKDLLKQKRDALLMEFMKVMDETLHLSEVLQRALHEAQFCLAVAEAVDGRVTVRSASFAAKGSVTVDMSGTKIMGISIPVVDKRDTPIRGILERGYSITGASSRIDEAAERFEKVVDIIINSADIETRLRRLGEEIQKTNRRVNALEQVFIPALRSQVSYIRMILDERAREDLFRLKKVKKSLEAGRAATANG